MQLSGLIFFLWGCLMSSFCFAETADLRVKQTLSKMGIDDMQIVESGMPLFKLVLTPKGAIYVSNDGQYLFQGQLFEMSSDRVDNLTTQKLYTQLQTQVSHFIEYKAEHEKNVIYVFMDMSCGYCHKLHQDIANYNQLGITVRYLFYPRQGVTSQTAQQMERIWCYKDQKQQFEKLFEGQSLTESCRNNVVQDHYSWGRLFGVSGTPAIILPDGDLLPGYVPASELNNILMNRSKVH